MKQADVYAGNRVLVCLLPGLGDALVASPFLKMLADEDASIDVLAMLPPVAEYAQSLDFVKNVILLPLLHAPLRSLPELLKLRARGYDIVFLPFPATRWQYAAVARIAAAHQLVAHDYGGLAAWIMSWGPHRKIALRGGHRAWENIRLLGTTADEPDSPSYIVPQSWRASTISGMIGLHPGTMTYKGNEARRWSLSKFLSLAERQLSRGRRVRIFIGPNELADADVFRGLLRDASCEIVAEPLVEAARKTAQCEVFVANDAGFGHLAAGLGVRTVSLFGMTSPNRALPLGPAVAVRPSPCPACHDEGLTTFACVRNIKYRCINEDLSVDAVDEAIERSLSANVDINTGRRTSDFRLYGKPRISTPKMTKT